MTPYEEGLELQHGLVRRRKDGAITDTLVLLEHPPVVTFGRRFDASHLRVSRETLAARGVAIHRVERGGQATYHGPGQLVGYIIADLFHHGRDIHRFVFNLEETVIRFLRGRGVEGRREDEHRGVWIGDAKIASVGIAVRRGITMHGFSMNVNNDLDPFAWIVPCGIPDGRVCSLAGILGAPQDLASVAFGVAEVFGRAFGYSVAAAEEE